MCALLVACQLNSKEMATINSTSKEGSPKVGYRKVVLIAGPNSHGKGAHDHYEGVHLLADYLRKDSPDWELVIATDGWPENPDIFDNAHAVLVYSDGGKGHPINSHLDQVDQLLEKKVGFLMLHYAVEVPKGSPSSERMLRAIGGYFETHWSVNPHWQANFERIPEHDVSMGIEPFSLQDEWYFNMRFVADKNGLSPILQAIPPATTMERANGPHSGNPDVREQVANKHLQTVAWVYERPEGGRGFGLTGAHFHSSWNNDSLRNLVLNAIYWVANAPASQSRQ